MIRVLIVEDEAVTRKGLIEFIPWEQIGVSSVSSAENGAEALKIIREAAPDIVISDIKMPKLSGIELCRRLRKRIPDCKIVFLSAYADKENLKDAIDLQAVSFLEKPVKRDRVVKLLGRLVEEIHTQRQTEKERKMKEKELLVLARQKLAHDLCVPMELESLKRSFYSAQIDTLYHTCYTTAIIKFSNPDGKMPGLLMKKTEALLSGVCSLFEKYGLCIGCIRNELYLILHLFSQNSLRDILNQDFFQSLKYVADNALEVSVPVYMGVGQDVRSIDNIFKSYQTAVITLQNLFFTGYNNISVYDERNVSKYTFDESKLTHFEDLLKKMDHNGTINFLNSIRDDFLNHAPVLEDQVKNAYIKILFILAKFIEDFNLNGDWMDLSEKSIMKTILEAETLNVLHELSVNLAGQVFKSIEDNKSTGHIVSEIKKLIHANYQNKELSIHFIGDNLYMSPTYLCYVFKKQSGQTLNAYITQVRMEKAKELLRDIRIKVYDISSLVGYTSSDHFTKIFKKHTGFSPSEYRKRCSA